MIEEKRAESLQDVLLYRGEAEACECKHLRRTPVIRVGEVLRPVQVVQQSRLLMPHEQPANGTGTFRMVPTTLWPVGPPCGMVCKHPENVEWARSMMPEEVRDATEQVEVTLDFCRTCPIFEKRQDQQ